MVHVKSSSPVFVRIDEYRDVLEVMGLIKNKLSEARETLGKINELKNEEDSELELWNTSLEEIEKKAEFIDRSLFQPEEL